jgi:hypothetical protein
MTSDNGLLRSEAINIWGMKYYFLKIRPTDKWRDVQFSEEN